MLAKRCREARQIETQALSLRSRVTREELACFELGNVSLPLRRDVVPVHGASTLSWPAQVATA